MRGSRPARRARGWLSAELRQTALSNPTPSAGPGPAPAPEAMRVARSQVERAREEYLAGERALAAGQLVTAYNHFVVARGFAGGDDILLAEIIAAQGRVRLAQSNHAAAAEAFREALAHNPANVEAHQGLAALAMATFRPAEAIDKLYAALALVPEPRRRSNIHLRLAEAHLQAAHPLLARPHLKAALRLGGVNPATVVFRFALTLPLAYWLVAAGAALLVAFILAPPELNGARFVSTAVLALVALLATLLAGLWLRTPVSKRARPEEQGSSD